MMKWQERRRAAYFLRMLARRDSERDCTALHRLRKIGFGNIADELADPAIIELHRDEQRDAEKRESERKAKAKPVAKSEAVSKAALRRREGRDAEGGGFRSWFYKEKFPPKRCTHCRKQFLAKRNDATTCSPMCRTALHRKRRQAK